MYFCACFVERTWRFGLPLVLAFVEGGFQAIAILGFVAPLACSLAGPAVGARCWSWLATLWRLPVATTCAVAHSKALTLHGPGNVP